MPPLADSGKRVLARIIDIILVSIVVGLLSWAFGIATYQTNPDKIQYGRSSSASPSSPRSSTSGTTPS